LENLKEIFKIEAHENPIAALALNKTTNADFLATASSKGDFLIIFNESIKIIFYKYLNLK
jgi:hypothetical protein